jgi:hypothetical protein
MDLHQFLIQLIQTDSLDLPQINSIIKNPSSRTELVHTLLTNYDLYEKLIKIKNGMDIG